MTKLEEAYGLLQQTRELLQATEHDQLAMMAEELANAIDIAASE
jgi:hypothetical protein